MSDHARSMSRTAWLPGYVSVAGAACIAALAELGAAVFLEYTDIHLEGGYRFSDFRTEGLSFVDSVEFVRKLFGSIHGPHESPTCCWLWR